MLRPCLSCGRLIPASASRCSDCQRAKYHQRAVTRDPVPVAIYASAGWRRLAAQVVADADACHWCGTSRAVMKLTADHIYPVRAHPELALEPDNVVAACRGCQERRKRRPDPRTWAEWERRPLR